MTRHARMLRSLIGYLDRIIWRARRLRVQLVQALENERGDDA